MTEYSPPWFQPHPCSRRHRRRAATSKRRRRRLEMGHYIVLFSLAAIITVRFFSEGLHAVPRAANFIDVPLSLVVVAAAAGHRKRASARPVHQSLLFGAGVLFLAVATISTLANFSRVDVFPVLTFVYDFLAPLVFYFAVYVLWEPGRSRIVSLLLVSLALVQFVAIVFYDLPEFLRNRNPDAVSGTFGTNAYQLVFFLLLFVALLIGIVTFEPRNPYTHYRATLRGLRLPCYFPGSIPLTDHHNCACNTFYRLARPSKAARFLHGGSGGCRTHRRALVHRYLCPNEPLYAGVRRDQNQPRILRGQSHRPVGGRLQPLRRQLALSVGRNGTRHVFEPRMGDLRRLQFALCGKRGRAVRAAGSWAARCTTRMFQTSTSSRD